MEEKSRNLFKLNTGNNYIHISVLFVAKKYLYIYI